MTVDVLLQTMTLTKDKPILSSERAPHNDKTVTVKQELFGARHQDRLTVSRNVTFLIKRTNSVACSPQANYTDRAKTACRRNYATLADRGCRVVSATDPHGY
jgi:hypothetical protein